MGFGKRYAGVKSAIVYFSPPLNVVDVLIDFQLSRRCLREMLVRPQYYLLLLICILRFRARVLVACEV